jgi:carboxypeptidase family protein
MRMGARSIGLFMSVVLVAMALSWGQTSTTSLRGTIVDPKDAVVPGAEVTMTNPATAFSRTTKTDGQGFYQFLEVPPATYTLTITASGFGTLRVENVRLLVNTPATLNQTLRVQTVAQSVEVMSQAPLVNTEDASIGHAFTADQMTTLPFEGRDPVSILSLQPGVLYTGNSSDIHPDADSRSGAVSGARSDQTDVTVDGLDDNDPVLGYAFQGALRSTLDSLEEFRVTTTNSNAEAGRSSGAQVSLVTKSGTNKFHGSLYEYNRSGIGEANSWFNERAELQAGNPNVPPHLVRNTFGTSIGGPIIKNRLFFFATYEGQRTHETAVVTRFVPTAGFRQGLLTYQCDNGGKNATCPAGGVFTLSKTDLANLDPLCFGLGNCPQGAGVDPAALAVFNSFPLPNDPTVGDGYNISGFTFADPTPTKLDTYIVKLDYNLTQNGSHHLFLRGNLQNDHQTSLGAEFPGQPPSEILTNNGKGLAAGYTTVISNSLINNFRYGYIREGVGKAGLQTTGYISFYAEGISNPVGETPTTTVQVPLHNFVDDLSWTKGKHSLQFGTNLRIINNLRQSNAQSFITGSSNPTWLAAGGISGTGTSLDPGAKQFAYLGLPEVSGSFTASYDLAATALTGMVPEVTASYQETKNFTLLPEDAMVPRHFRAHEAEWYAQDAWRVKPNLTLTFGLRYSLLQPPYETTGTQVAPNPGIHQWFRNRYIGMAEGQSIQPPFTFSLSGQANGKPPIWNWDYKNFAPRFAFAWSPNFSKQSWLGKMFGESGKSSVRGGYGIYFDHFGEGVINSFDRMGSFGLTSIIGDPAGLVTPDQSPRFSSLYNIPKTYNGCGSPPCLLQPSAPTGGFPYAPPSTPGAGGEAISWGLDNGLRTPYSHVVDLSFTRDVGRGFVVETSYVGRFGHRLLQQLDVAQPINLRDPKSGMDLYTATRMIAAATQAGTPVQNMKKIPYFEDLFPLTAGPAALASLQANSIACAPGASPANPSATQNMYQLFSCNGGVDMTTELLQPDWYCVPACPTLNGVTKPFQFWAPQFSSLYVWSTTGNSSYNALQASLRRKMSGGLQFDFNYTYSKSIDLGSDAERVNQYEGGSGVAGGGFASYIMNTWSPNQNRAVSDFDATHQFNANWMYQLPVGKGKHFATHGALDAIFGNWELTGIFRMTSGFPTTVNDGNYWPTNWENTANSILVGPKPKSGTFMVNGSPNIFQNPCCDPVTSAIAQFRYALPGEGGERNLIRGAGYFGIDMGLGKTWNITESSALRFSWETFNITNSVRFDAAALEPIAGSNASGNLSLSNSSSFGYYTSTLTSPRVMQFALRYSF